jgi:hypothetical protein
MFPSGKGWDSSVNVDSNVVNPNFEYQRGLEEDVGGEIVHDEVVEEENADEAKEDESSGEVEVSGLPLERCMRILPHDQNTGGFFIAVFRKTSAYKGTYTKL